jgi:hypothetical protein
MALKSVSLESCRILLNVFGSGRGRADTGFLFFGVRNRFSLMRQTNGEEIFRRLIRGEMETASWLVASEVMAILLEGSRMAKIECVSVTFHKPATPEHVLHIDPALS